MPAAKRSRMSEQKSCLIVFKEETQEFEVELKGLWIRRDLDACRVAMLQALIKKASRDREELKRKENEDG